MLAGQNTDLLDIRLPKIGFALAQKSKYLRAQKVKILTSQIVKILTFILPKMACASAHSVNL